MVWEWDYNFWGKQTLTSGIKFLLQFQNISTFILANNSKTVSGINNN